MAHAGNQQLEWSVAERPFPGEMLSGDSHLVLETANGWLMAVVDGLGHGPEAAEVGNVFIDTLSRYADLELAQLILRCHKALRNTRGGACAIATIDSARHLLTWIGIGNVEGAVCHGDGIGTSINYITMRGGIVGYRLPELQPSHQQLADGDIVAMATDGINTDFVEMLKFGQKPGRLAGRILNRYAVATDDALVLVARWHSRTGKKGGDEM